MIFQTENKAMGQKLALLNQRHDQAVGEVEALHTNLLQMEDENEQLAEQLKVLAVLFRQFNWIYWH